MHARARTHVWKAARLALTPTMSTLRTMSPNHAGLREKRLRGRHDQGERVVRVRVNPSTATLPHAAHRARQRPERCTLDLRGMTVMELP
jgi:hypothetical protein